MADQQPAPDAERPAFEPTGTPWDAYWSHLLTMNPSQEIIQMAQQLIPAYARAQLPLMPFDQFRSDLLNAVHLNTLERQHFPQQVMPLPQVEPGQPPGGSQGQPLPPVHPGSQGGFNEGTVRPSKEGGPIPPVIQPQPPLPPREQR